MPYYARRAMEQYLASKLGLVECLESVLRSDRMSRKREEATRVSIVLINARGSIASLQYGQLMCTITKVIV